MIRKRLLVLLFFLLGTFLLYFPVLGNGFLTDDYAALHRILIEKRILYKEFLRPLIDITFYGNWVFSGLHPVGYYVFNFIVHALTCWMVYRVALDLPGLPDGQQEAIALTAGFLFLVYPFHNEGVVWLAGRLSSMAALFGLLAIHFSLTKAGPWGFLGAALCWFIGLFAYESIIILPAMILVLEWMKYRNAGRVVRSAMAWGVTGLLCVAMRYFVAGRIVPAYGPGGMGQGSGVRLVKVLGRCFLPPLENPRWMIILSVGLVLVTVGVQMVLWRRRGGRVYLWLEGLFLLALMPAMAFGVSTRTSEGDRVLYFPSCFLCILISALLFFFVTRARRRLLFGGIAAIGGIIFISMNNRNWVVASRTASTVLDTLRAAPGRVVLVNAPDEWEGAYIFRNNFKEGLEVNGVDVHKVVVTHFLMRLEYLPVRGWIEPEREDSGVFIYPATRIVMEGSRFRVVGMPDSFDGAVDRVYYWDKFDLKPLILRQ
jgi:hypothetical protein